MSELVGAKRYHVIWLWLFLAWTVCYIDRSLTGPVITWMIQNQAGFMADAPMQHALGGIVGSMFFAGYMLTQFPAGYFGDRYGHRTMVVLSTAWAGIATLGSGFARSLTSFVTMRVVTGLGEGAYYSNDRAIVDEVTPPHRKGLAMGVVFVGLAVGLTTATVLSPYIMDRAADAWGKETAWTVPFLLFAPITLLVSFGLLRTLRPRAHGEGSFRKALASLLMVSVPLLVAIMAVFQLTIMLGLGSIVQALAITALAFLLVVVIYRRLGQVSAAVLRDRDLVMMYVSSVPILYTLWFFGFWALLVVSESASLGLEGAAVYAGLFGVANAIGFPLGGWMCDRGRSNGKGRKMTYVALCAAVALAVFMLAWCIAMEPLNVVLLAVLLFVIGVLFSAMQTVHMTLTSDLAPRSMMGQAFGMWNLVAEIGAILSPVVSGTLRDMTGDWTLATIVTGVLLLISAAIVLFVREDAKANNPGRS